MRTRDPSDHLGVCSPVSIPGDTQVSPNAMFNMLHLVSRDFCATLYTLFLYFVEVIVLEKYAFDRREVTICLLTRLYKLAANTIQQVRKCNRSGTLPSAFNNPFCVTTLINV